MRKHSIKHDVVKIGFLALLAFAICFIAKAYAEPNPTHHASELNDHGSYHDKEQL